MSLTGYGNTQAFQAITHSEIEKYFLKSELFPDNLGSSLCSGTKIKLKVLW